MRLRDGRGAQGLYVRVNIGNTGSGERRYLVCEVLGIRDKASDYQVLQERERESLSVLKITESKMLLSLQFVLVSRLFHNKCVTLETKSRII